MILCRKSGHSVRESNIPMFVQQCALVQEDQPNVQVMRELRDTIVPTRNPDIWAETEADVD